MVYRRLLLWIFSLVSLMFAVTSPLKAEEKLELKLIEMRAEALSEERGDEVYLSVTKYSNINPSEEYRIPSSPKNWEFKKLDAVRNVTLWKGTLAKGEEIELMVTIAEQDFPPWDVDDLIGTLQVNLKESQGRLQQDWVIPDIEGQPKIDDKGAVAGKGRRYILHGDNSRYEVELVVTGSRS